MPGLHHLSTFHREEPLMCTTDEIMINHRSDERCSSTDTGHADSFILAVRDSAIKLQMKLVILSFTHCVPQVQETFFITEIVLSSFSYSLVCC